MTSTAPRPSKTLRTASLTTLAMVAFAANSILCRAALGGGTIDAASFSTVRLVSGAMALALLHTVLSGRGSLFTDRVDRGRTRRVIHTSI